MRAKDFTTESAVEELKNKLPRLKKTDYDSIDELMTRISKRYKITGKKLHDLFVHKYGHTPDAWVKKIKNRLSNEEVEPTDDGAFTTWDGGMRVAGPMAYEKARQLDLDSFTEDDNLDENLHKWFKEKWVRFGPDGKIRGACARGDDSEGKPKCLPQAKAHSLGKKGRKYAASKKRREDPNPERRGPAKNVATKKKSNESVAVDSLNEFAPQRGGDAGDYFRTLASAWYNGTFNSRSLQKGIKSQEDIERLLARGIVCPDGKTRKFEIGYNSDFDGVVIYSYDYYEYGDDNDQGQTIDSRTGRPWGPYDYMEFKDEELDESVAEGSLKEFAPPEGGDNNNDRNRILRKLLEIAIKVAEENNVGTLGMVHAMNTIAGDDFFSVAVEGLLPDITDRELIFILQTAYKTVKQGNIDEGEVIPFPKRPEDFKKKQTTLSPMQKRRALSNREPNKAVYLKDKNVVSAPSIYDIYEQMIEEAANRAQQAAIAISMKKAGKKPKKVKENKGNTVFQNMGKQLISIGAQADKVKHHSVDKIENAIEKKIEEIGDPKLARATETFLQKAVKFNRNNPKTMAAIFGFTFAIIARVSMQVSHHYGLSPTQATLILEATLPTLGNFIGYLVNGFSVKDAVQSGLIAGAIGVGGTLAASGALTEFANTGGDDGDDDDREYDDRLYKKLHELASQWWLGNEEQMEIVQDILASMGWEIGEDEGYDNGGVFVVRAGDIHGKSYISWPHEDLKLNESISEDVTQESDMQKINDFIDWSIEKLNIQKRPKFTFSKDTDMAQKGHHTGVHSGNNIWVYIANRNLIDILRTIFHELVHQRQDELNMIKNGDSYPGSPIEALADMMAGKYIKIYGKEHPEIFQ